MRCDSQVNSCCCQQPEGPVLKRVVMGGRFFTFSDMVHPQSLAAVQALRTGSWRSPPRRKDQLSILMLTGVP